MVKEYWIKSEEVRKLLSEEIKVLKSIKERFASLEDELTDNFGFGEDCVASGIWKDLERRIGYLKRQLNNIGEGE